jgi:Endoplasmic Reticulum Oxidoreductin 1 (ERO1)
MIMFYQFIVVGRLMSGLQASISTHIAQQYYYPDGRWDTNIPLFVKAVGSHPDRLNNLYFTFLFVLRAVTKAGSVLTEYPYHTGNKADDEMVKTLIRRLVKSRPPGTSSGQFSRMKEKETNPKKPATIANGLLNRVGVKTELDQCRTGFDESMLFQVNLSVRNNRVYAPMVIESSSGERNYADSCVVFFLLTLHAHYLGPY